MRASPRWPGFAFAAAARSYWLEILPVLRREREDWRRRARGIPNGELRRDALFAIDEKWGHSEGAAAFAALAPRSLRRDFVRMATAYQLMIDYLDTTSERPVSDPFGNTIQLHRAPRAAVTIEPSRYADYYMLHAHRDDGGYLMSHVARCREIFASLPSARAIAGSAGRFAALYAEAQGHCHAEEAGLPGFVRTHRIDEEAARHPELQWGEILAAADTSLPVLALMALAARPGLSQGDVQRCCAAYFPWTSSLHILLHGLVDEAADRAGGQFNQLSHYESKDEAAERIALIASRARELLDELPQGGTHLALLAGMVGYYLASPEVWRPESASIAAPLIEAVGPLAQLAIFAHRRRRPSFPSTNSAASCGPMNGARIR